MEDGHLTRCSLFENVQARQESGSKPMGYSAKGDLFGF